MAEELLRFDPGLAPVAPPCEPKRARPMEPWVISRYQEVTTLLRHPGIVTVNTVDPVTKLLSSIGRDPAPMARLINLVPLLTSDEAHRRVSGLAQQLVDRVGAFWTGEQLGRASREILVRAENQHGCDAYHQLAEPFTCELAARLLAIDDVRPLRDKAHFFFDHIYRGNPRLKDFVELLECAEAFIRDCEQLRGRFPIPDGLAPEDNSLLLGIIAFPISGTLSIALTFGIVTLARLPDLAALLRDRPELRPAYVREVLRLANALRWTGRARTLEAIPLPECVLPAGTVFRCNLEQANRDPSVFEQPHLIDLARKTRGIPFGVGPHTCLGAQFAVRVLSTFLGLMLDEFTVSNAGPIVELDQAIGRGYVHAPIKLRRRR